MNHDDLAALVRSVRPSDADRVDDLFSRARQDELFNEIVRAPTGAQAVGPRRARPDWMPTPRAERRPAACGATSRGARRSRDAGLCRGDRDRPFACAPAERIGCRRVPRRGRR